MHHITPSWALMDVNWSHTVWLLVCHGSYMCFLRPQLFISKIIFALSQWEGWSIWFFDSLDEMPPPRPHSWEFFLCSCPRHPLWMNLWFEEQHQTPSVYSMGTQSVPLTTSTCAMNLVVAHGKFLWSSTLKDNMKRGADDHKYVRFQHFHPWGKAPGGFLPSRVVDKKRAFPGTIN